MSLTLGFQSQLMVQLEPEQQLTLGMVTSAEKTFLRPPVLTNSQALEAQTRIGQNASFLIRYLINDLLRSNQGLTTPHISALQFRMMLRKFKTTHLYSFTLVAEYRTILLYYIYIL